MDIKYNWRKFKMSAPGRRFQDHYDRINESRQKDKSTSLYRYLLSGLLIAIGIVFIVIPGPAILFFFLAASFIASESRIIARFFDGMELKIHAAWSKLKR